jgi:hypothetical protein
MGWLNCIFEWAKLNDLSLFVIEATTEFCGSVAAVVAVASSPELVAHPFGVSLVVATVDLQNSVAATVAASSLDLCLYSFVLVVVATIAQKGSCSNNNFYRP